MSDNLNIMDCDVEEKKLDVKICQGDGSELEISQVFEHLNCAKPKFDKIKKIIIPKKK